jgi:hypothetical protein
VYSLSVDFPKDGIVAGVEVKKVGSVMRLSGHPYHGKNGKLNSGWVEFCMDRGEFFHPSRGYLVVNQGLQASVSASRLANDTANVR